MFDESSPQHRFMLRAIELSKRNVEGGNGGPFGSVVVRAGVVVGEGANEVTLTNDPTAHAEVVAIRRACEALKTFDLAGCEIYASCEPCPMCLSAIYWARIGKLYFAATKEDAERAGFDDSKIYRELALPLHEREVPTLTFLREEANQAFAAWAKAQQKVLY